MRGYISRSLHIMTSPTFVSLLPRTEVVVLGAVNKDFWSEPGFHPSSSFILLQCYTRGNPFKAREGRLGKKQEDKKAQCGFARTNLAASHRAVG